MNCVDTLKSLCLTILIGIAIWAKADDAKAAGTETLIVAGGCFWCVEADFEKVKGVTQAVSGYSGGSTDNPSYKQVTRGGTGHYEAVQINFDPAVVTRAELMHLFLRSIDPTDAGGQFCDRGNSYRSAIFVSGDAEESTAKAALEKAQADLGQTIVTPILPRATFYKAEDYHQDYYKGSSLVLTRAGPKSQATAYKFYRKSCGRDARVKELWGSAAPFAGS